MSGSDGTACYTVRLRLRVTKQRTQRIGKLLISNLCTSAGVHDRRRGFASVGQERYCSLSLPDMMSK
ncbi:hypothetical protein GA0061098_1008274 [Bradyrhizobium shewense]|uniref:Uncharacterized protein n=1 Tax=Bradyrhizobium shewense TaxID=1761772 RepID=A0A1C3WMY7_9BRAD|nr:hypothetical protein GA0061098_1008274 [Bradyrhizobium shewense]